MENPAGTYNLFAFFELWLRSWIYEARPLKCRQRNDRVCSLFSLSQRMHRNGLLNSLNQDLSIQSASMVSTEHTNTQSDRNKISDCVLIDFPICFACFVCQPRIGLCAFETKCAACDNKSRYEFMPLCMQYVQLCLLFAARAARHLTCWCSTIGFGKWICDSRRLNKVATVELHLL